VEAPDDLQRVLERAQAVAPREVVRERHSARGPAGEEARDERVLQGRWHDGDRRPVRQELRQVERVRSQQRVLEVDHAEPPVLHVEVPGHVVAVREHVRSLERHAHRLQGREQTRALTRLERAPAARLDAVLDEVLQLRPREGAVEPAAEGVAARVPGARPEVLERDQQVDGLLEERARVGGRRLGGGEQRRVADVLQEEQRVRARGRVVIDGRDGGGRRHRG
jgi:hypothetical protein